MYFSLESLQIDYEEPVSQTGQTPWISLSGIELRDSPLSMSLLAETFGIDLNSALSLDEKVKAKAIQIVAEEHLQSYQAKHNKSNDRSSH